MSTYTRIPRTETNVTVLPESDVMGERTVIITMRLPLSLHAALMDEARNNAVSLNKLCVAKANLNVEWKGENELPVVKAARLISAPEVKENAGGGEVTRRD